MPIYEYQCKACGRTFEYQQKMSEDPKTVCESCGGALERLISRTAFALKGGGWYKDLYSSPKPSGDSKSSESKSSESKPSDGGSAGDSKPAATESKPAATESKPAATTPKKGGD